VFPLVRKSTGSEDVDIDPQEFTHFYLNFTNIKQGGVFRWVDKQIQIAFSCIFTAQNGAEDSCVNGMMTFNDAPNGFSVLIKCDGWLHGTNPGSLMA